MEDEMADETAVKQIRTELRRTMEEFAQLFGRSKAMISLYESGAKIPSWRLAQRMIDVAQKRGAAKGMTLDKFYQSYAGRRGR